MSHKWTVFTLSLLLITAFIALFGGDALQAQSTPPTPTPRPLADPNFPDGERTDFDDSSTSNSNEQADPAVPTACSVPVTASVRGKSVTFDQCYERTFNFDGTTYRIHVFYTEQDTATNLAQCDADENAVGRCEHKLSNNDDANGDNINAVAMAVESEAALRFYLERDINMISGTTLSVYIAEDPRGGGINGASGLYADDELIDNNDVIWKRLLAFHEGMHLVQDKYDNGGVGWQSFYGEGIARAIEDRVDTDMDADTGHLFIPEVNGILASEGNRTDDIVNTTYRSVLWWTWLMDQYREPSDSEPDIGWTGLRDFYIELNSESDQVKAVNDFITAEGGSFRDDFIDYTLSLYAYDRNPADPRLTYLDNEIRNNTNGLSNHTVINSGPSFGDVSVSMSPRSVRFIEFDPASQCDFVAFTFDGNGKNYGFSVLTDDGGNLQNRWTSYSKEWARTVRSADLDSVVGVVTAFDKSGNVTVGRGCVEPKLNIKNPTTAVFEMIGTADNPRNFLIRLDVDGQDGSGVAGLTAGDFTVEMQKAGGGPVLNATVINAAYVQDDYWLLVTPPDDGDGAETGQFYNLTVHLGSQSDSENSALLYVKRTQDVVIVLDRSGSMGASGKIEAARNAASLLVNELASDDQGAYVAFDTTADLKVQLNQVSVAHREALENAINGEIPLNATAIGLGMNTAATEHDARGIAENMCSFVLLSDGYENVSPYWADVQADVADNGCALHTIALGPQANELLMQQIATAVPGGSYDYADTSGNVPIGFDTQNGLTSLSWQNNLSRIYDNKATQLAGRQRLQTAQSRGGGDLPLQEYDFYVDPTASELVIAVAWQFPSTQGQSFKLIDPNGDTVVPDYQRTGNTLTNEVLKVLKPIEGTWQLQVFSLYQEHFVSVSSLTDYELYLYIGTPLGDLTQGAKVPILGAFVGSGEPVTGATMTGTVRSPNGMVTTVMLYDDGNHGDGEPNDGLYGGEYTATAISQDSPPDPEKITDGEEPTQLGSYLVNLVATRGELRREAQGSFAIETGADENNNRLPDAWEEKYGVSDPGGDDDLDKLTNYCEFLLGTDPRNPDTDGGGESDGSEAPNCQIIRNPLDPSDDKIGPILSLTVRPEIIDLTRFIVVNWGNPLFGQLQFVNIYRRVPGGEWGIVGEEVEGNLFYDGNVANGMTYEYMIEPTIDGLVGGMVASTAVTAKDDPYAPAGSILINDGDESTTNRLVKLSIAADDLWGEGDGDAQDGPLPGSATEDLEMRLNNTPDFTGVAWQPFASEVLDWDLGPVNGGDTAVVYIQFRDEAGNVSETGFGHSDSIFFAEWRLNLPIVTRQ